MTEETLFDAALGVPEAERGAFLERACGKDAAMHARVQALLAANEAPDPQMDRAHWTQNEPIPSPSAITAMMQPEMKPQIVIGGRYTLLEKIGEGGMGEVWVARQSAPVKRRVALKLIKTGMDSKAVLSRFEQERQALAMMDHPNIAKVLDGGMTPTGQPYFVMELVNGLSLMKYCDEAKLTPRQRLELFIPVCHAVQHAHQKGIIHRDLKPANLLVTEVDNNPVPKVIDFGVAKATAGKLTDDSMFTQFGAVVGTLDYMAPEQAGFASEDIDTRADIYSLGVILYELLTGMKPIDAKRLKSTALLEMIRVIREEEPSKPSTRVSTEKTLPAIAASRQTDPRRLATILRGDLDCVVMKCLEKSRNRRYETVNGLAADIKRHLANEPVLARPPSTAYRCQKAWQRNKLAYSAGGAVLAALLIGIAVSLWQAVRATRAENEQSRLHELAVKALEGEKAQHAHAEAERQRAALAQVEAETNAENARQTAIKARRSQYAADVFAATTQIERGGYLTARNFLREYFPREGVEELRGFEWRYWWQFSAGQQLKTVPFPRSIRDMAWSPDGQLIAVSEAVGLVKTLRAATGQVVTEFKIKPTWNCSIAFSHDGNGLASGGDDTVSFFDVRDGRLIFELTGYKHPRVACSPAGPRMAIGTGGDWWGEGGDDVHLVDTTSGKVIRVLPKAGDRAAFSRDGKKIATANRGAKSRASHAVVLWDADSGERLGVIEDKRQVLSLVFSPDDSLLAIGTRNGEITLWNLKDFSRTMLRAPTKDYVRSVAFSPDGQRLAAAMQTHEVEVWDLKEGKRVETWRGHTGELTAVGYSPDGTQLASACEDGTLRYWDPKPSTLAKQAAGAYLPEYFHVGYPTFSPDSRSVAVAMQSGDVQIFDPETVNWKLRKVLPKAGYPVAFSGNAATLLSLNRDLQTVHRWDAASGAMLSTIPLDSAKKQCFFSVATADGSRLALADRQLIEVLDTRDGSRLASFQSPVLVTSLAFSSDGKLLAISGDGPCVLWDIAASRPVWTAGGHQTRVTSIRFSPDQKMIATTSWDASVRLWDAANGNPLATLSGHKAGVLNSVFSPDGRTLITGSDDSSIRFWNMASLREVASIPATRAFSFAFSPDGQILVANNNESSAILCWRAPTLADIDAAQAKEKGENKQH